MKPVKPFVSPFADLDLVDGTPNTTACLNDRRIDDARRDAWCEAERRRTLNPATDGKG